MIYSPISAGADEDDLSVSSSNDVKLEDFEQLAEDELDEGEDFMVFKDEKQKGSRKWNKEEYSSWEQALSQERSTMTKEAKKDLQATEQIIEDRLKLMEKYTQSV